MKQKKPNWQKIGVYYLFYAVGIAAVDWILNGAIDINNVVAVPIIAIGLLYFINKDKFMIQ